MDPAVTKLDSNSFLQTLLELSSLSKDQKIFFFALRLSQIRGAETRQTVKAAFAVAQTYERAMLAVTTGFPDLKNYKVADVVVIGVGSPSVGTSPPPTKPEQAKPVKIKVRPEAPAPSPEAERIGNVENLFKLLSDQYAKTPEEQAAIETMLKRINTKE